jgi:lysophospholipase L1-like esterase
MTPVPSDTSRTLLAFGDSNTWGYVPGTGARYPRSVRWPGVLSTALGANHQVVEAGLSGRTTVFEDPMGDKAGVRHLGPVLASAAPVDLVAILLGTNDLKARFAATPFGIAEGAGLLIDRVRQSAAGPGGAPPEVLLLTPPPVVDALGEARGSDANRDFEQEWANAALRSQQFAAQFARVARLRGVANLNLGNVIQSSPSDGIHWESAAHAVVGRAVASWVMARWPAVGATP